MHKLNPFLQNSVFSQGKGAVMNHHNHLAVRQSKEDGISTGGDVIKKDKDEFSTMKKKSPAHKSSTKSSIVVSKKKKAQHIAIVEDYANQSELVERPQPLSNNMSEDMASTPTAS